jgi:hypothetical protein
MLPEVPKQTLADKHETLSEIFLLAVIQYILSFQMCGIVYYVQFIAFSISEDCYRYE